jgi:hypothetical protein
MAAFLSSLLQMYLAPRPSEADAVLAIRSRLKSNAYTSLTSLQTFDTFWQSLLSRILCLLAMRTSTLICSAAAILCWALQVYLAPRPSEADAVLAIRSRLKTNACGLIASLQATLEPFLLLLP